MPHVKTSLPRLSAGHVPRPRLNAALEAAVPGQVTLVCAPAGYGKTLLLAEWAGRRPERTAWVSLDADDDDDHRFWSAVLSAFDSCPVVPADSALRDLAVPPHPSSDPEFLAAVVNAVELVPAPVCLVLDDVHELTAAEPRHGLAALVRDRPAGLHLVLAGRSDPPLPLGRMRLMGEVVEIRAEALRFSVPEAGALLAAADVASRPDQVRLLVEQTQGWAAGLRLAALSLREADDPDRFLADFAGNSRAVSDYLVGEILARLPADVLDLLRAVSVCDPLSASLAAALSGRADAGEVLDSLEHDTSLVLSSGEGRLWYRVHPLLRSHLLADLRRRRPDLGSVLHGRAADWYAASGDPVQALTQARHSGDAPRVASLLRRWAVALIGDGEHGALHDTLAWLADRSLDEDAWLALAGAAVEIEAGALTAAEAHLARAEAAWPVAPTEDLMALRALVRARRVSLAGVPTEMVEATEGLVEMPESARGLDVMGDLDRALALVTVGRGEEAEAVMAGALRRARASGQAYLVARGLTVQSSIEAVRGNYRRMAEVAEEADAVLPEGHWTTTAGAAMSSVLRAYGALLEARPAACLELLAPALAFGDSGSRPVASVAATVRALRGAALVDLGRVGEGLDELRRARVQAAAHPGMVATDALVAMLEHGAAVQLGRHELARTVLTWAEAALGRSGEVALMRAQRLSALGRTAAADDVIRPVLDGHVPVHLPWALIEAGVLECRSAILGERRQHARATLDRVLGLSRSMGVMRPLALGPADVVALLTGLLGSFGDLDPTARTVLGARQELGVHDRPVGLTDRERAVLRLLPSQRSLDEIATDLTVSHSTVKTHVRSIYSKLGVRSRREAVERARTSGLLTAEVS